MAPLTGVPEEIALAQFINGLKDDVKSEVRVLGSLNLDHAMELAIMVEEKLRSSVSRHTIMTSSSLSYSGNFYSSSPKSHSSVPSSSSRSVYSHSSSSPFSFPSPTVRSTGSLPVAKPVGEFKRLNERELHLKREKGECFQCHEKWSVGHRCKKRELDVILIQGEVEEVDTEGEIGCTEFVERENEAV